MPDTPSISRRLVLGVLAGSALTGCSLRLENDAPLPGTKASPAPDTGPLRQIRTRLVAARDAAAADVEHRQDAQKALNLHREQLTRLDATLEGLGVKNLPRDATSSASASSTSAPSASSTPALGASHATTPATVAHRDSASSTASSSGAASSPSSSTPPNSTWTRAEAAWVSPATTTVLSHVSRASRPLAMAIAARSLACLAPLHVKAEWPDAMTVPADAAGELRRGLEAAIELQEWVAATTPLDGRADVTWRLDGLYAARSTVDAAGTSTASTTPTPPQHPASSSDAGARTRAALAHVVSACATGAAFAASPADVAGLLACWSHAVACLQQLGQGQGAFPGLSAG